LQIIDILGWPLQDTQVSSEEPRMPSVKRVSQPLAAKAVSTAAAPWRCKLQAKKAAKVVVLEKPFAGIPAGSKLLIATPQIFARYLGKIPYGEACSIVRVRNELARQHRAHATCPVTTAIFLRIVAESALEMLADGAAAHTVPAFWRVIAPDSTIARKLSCDANWLAHMRTSEGIVD
jgi:hypothetical protein